MSLPSLPYELLLHIASYLEPDDLKALCFVHPKCKNAARPFLFSVALLSKTKLDLRSFLGIANSPHLASLPRRLVWHELVRNKNKAFWDDTGNSHISWLALREDKMALSHIWSIMNNAFWTLPFAIAKHLEERVPLDPPARNINYSNTFMKDFEHGNLPPMDQSPQAVHDIYDAVKKLTNLDTIVAQTMPLGRTLAVVPDYRLTSDVFQTTDDVNCDSSTDGLFLLDKDCLGEKISSQIRSLYLGGTSGNPKNFAVIRQNTTLWKNLEFLDLAISDAGGYKMPQSYKSEDILEMATCLQSAPKLRHLRFTLDNWNLDRQDHFGFYANLFGDSTLWPALETLELYGLDMRRRQWIPFFKRHASTLRNILTCECRGPDGKMVYQLAAIPELKLKSFRVRQEGESTPSNNPYNDIYLVSEERLLAFINNESMTCPIKERRRIFTTGPFRFDPRQEPRLVYFDMASERQPLDLRNNTLDDLPLNPIETANTPATGGRDTENGQAAEDHQQKQKQTTQQVHPKLVQASVYTDEDRAVVKKWLEETQQIDAQMDDEVPENNDIFATPEEVAAATARAAAAKAADKRHTQRIAARPYWRWCRQPDPSQPTLRGLDVPIYYWETKTPEGSHRTEAWHFFREYPDGSIEHAFGAEPLQCFSDWDSEIDAIMESGVSEGKEDLDLDMASAEKADGVVAGKVDENANEGAGNETQKAPENSGPDEQPAKERVTAELVATMARSVAMEWTRGIDPNFEYTDAVEEPRRSVRMWAEPSFYCPAFEQFLKNEEDMGDPLEDDAVLCRVAASDIPDPSCVEYELSDTAFDCDQEEAMSQSRLLEWRDEVREDVNF